MNQTSRQMNAARGQAGFPLASLALLMTFFAVALACTDLNRWPQQVDWLRQDWPWRVVIIFGGMALAGGLIGVAHLFFLPTAGRTRWIAPLAGVLAGQVGALILVAPGSIWRVLFAVCVLLATAILLRLGAE